MKTYLSNTAAKVLALATASYVGLGVGIASAQTDPHPIEEFMIAADLETTKDAIQAAMLLMIPITLLWVGWRIYKRFIKQI